MSSVYENELKEIGLSELQMSKVCALLSGSSPKVVVKGRPSKSKKEVYVGGESDVFSQLLSMEVCGDSRSDVSCVSEVKKLDKESMKLEKESMKLEKEILKQEKETDKIIAAGEKLEKETEKLAAANAKSDEKNATKQAKESAAKAKDDAKAEKESAKASALQAKESAKLAKEEAVKAKEAAKAEKELAKESAKLAKEEAVKAKESAKAEKDAEKATKAAAKAEKDAEKATKAAAKAEKDVESKPADEPAVSVDESLAPPLSKVDAVRVKKFSFGGVKYLRDTAGTIYDPASQDRIGVWNEEDKKIVFDAKGDEEDECSEEEYEDADE